MMRGEMRGDSDEQAITMMDRAEETSAKDGGSRRMNRDKMSKGQRVEDQMRRYNHCTLF